MSTIRELTPQEMCQVSGGDISSSQAGGILAGFGASVAAGAAVGALLGGPGGMVAGAIIGGSRAAITYGFGALVGGGYALSI